ncbi:MAG: tRNA (guanosine(37)-N1)-methyltransferase TrmD [Oscillospiraceae bacterium]|nr:tRNA (guanosine(37)-N1)-methyltransferase TrmD [Oscillospiraceae bacterium]
MRFDILTLFPEMLAATLDDSIIGRAKSAGILDINYINIRDFSANKHRKVDDYPYGGGTGMVMTCQPIFDAYQSVTKDLPYKPLTIYLTPQGKLFRQSVAKKLTKERHIILICGHYEGVDQRVLDSIVDMELSVGDFVLTGGEIAAMAVVDAVGRLIDGVLPNEDAHNRESLNGSLLEHPQYTRPAEWNGANVPEVLLNGNHAEIEKWKREQSITNTLNKRPAMLRRAKLSDSEKKFVENTKRA